VCCWDRERKERTSGRWGWRVSRGRRNNCRAFRGILFGSLLAVCFAPGLRVWLSVVMAWIVLQSTPTPTPLDESPVHTCQATVMPGLDGCSCFDAYLSRHATHLLLQLFVTCVCLVGCMSRGYFCSACSIGHVKSNKQTNKQKRVISFNIILAE
jgi:hypothetical protein